MLESLPETMEKRKKILKVHFGELYAMKPDEESIENRITRIIGKIHPHPYIYFASSIGFNKMTWSKTIEKFLAQFGLGMRLKYPTLRNYQKYEKLKYLLLKYFERIKELGLQNETLL